MGDFFENMNELQQNSVDSLIKNKSETLEFLPSYMALSNVGILSAIYSAAYGMVKPINFIDAAGGEGFPSIMANKAGMHSFYQDIDPQMKELADNNIASMIKKGAINSEYTLETGLGDMFNLQTYKENFDMNFSNFNIFFSYLLDKPKREFINLFSKEAKSGARMIVLPGMGERSAIAYVNRNPGIDINFRGEKHSDMYFTIFEKK